MALETVINLLEHPVPEVRAAAAFALGTLVANQSTDNATAARKDASISHALVLAVARESSVLVRKELLVALSAFVVDFEAAFVSLATKLLQERKSVRRESLPRAPLPERQASVQESGASRVFSFARVPSVDWGSPASANRLLTKPTASPPRGDVEQGRELVVADMRQLLANRVARNIYESVLLSLLRLVRDPSPEVQPPSASS